MEIDLIYWGIFEMKISLEKILANILFLMVLFPYVTPLNTPFDTQPFSMLLAGIMFSLYIMKKRDSMPKSLFVLMLLIPYAIVLTLLLTSDLISGLRSLAGYFTIFFVGFATYQSFHLIKHKLLIFAAWLWLFVGIIQFFFLKSFGHWILPRISTSEARGVTSLAVEPSYYAIVMVFMMLLNEIFYAKGYFNKNQYKLLIALASIQIIMSFSGMGFLFLIVFTVSKSISVIMTQSLNKKLKSILAVSVVLTSILIAFTSIPKLAYSRAGILISQFWVDPASVILYDYSIAQRLSHIIISSLSIFQNFGLGFGVGEFELKVHNVISDLPTPIRNLFITQGIDPGGRIMSGWGSSIFELGIIGLIPLTVFIYIMLKAMRKKHKEVYVTCFLVVFLLMWMAVPYSFPLFAYLLGVVMFFVYRERKLKTT
jgi:hypothetical protein